MKTKLQVIQNMGVPWTVFRAKYEIEKKLGLLKKQFPIFSYTDVNLNSKINIDVPLKTLIKQSLEKNFFQFDYEVLNISKKNLNLSKAISDADDILDNKFYYFSKHPIEFKRIDWHYSPFTKKKSPNNKHWTEIADLSSEFGDIKWIWELSRFSFTYPLCRAYSITKNEKYSKAFWELFDDFIKHNPPEIGVNYKCGQEMSLRVMAWTFALNVFIDSPETTNERLEMMMKAIYHHANHVEKHFNFALKSVKNNHSLSEALGMYTVGTVFDFFNLSKNWMNKGKKFLQSEAMWQIYDDGSYIQHSFNYHRLAIQDLTWFLRLAQFNKHPLDNSFIKKFEKTIEFLYQMQESKNGRVPNYGMNDGAYIHPLTSKDYLDYRPSLQAAWLMLTGNRLYEENDINEIAIWFGLDIKKSVVSPVKKSIIFKNGGYITLRKENQFAMVRCASYKHRPAQADMLHIDFWDGEYNILADAGTYSYNTSQEDLLYFNGTSSHNTIKLNDKDQMQKASRFIWLNWTKSKIMNFQENNTGTFFEGEHFGYSPIIHRRGVYQTQDILVVVDDLYGKVETESVSLQWLFGIKDICKLSKNKFKISLPNSSAWTIDIYSSNKFDSQSFFGSDSPVSGWRSLYYGHKEAFPQLIIGSEIKEPSRFITIFRKDSESMLSITDYNIIVDNCNLELLPIGSKSVFKYMEL